MRVKKIHRLLRILFVLGAASVLLACPGESSSDNGTTGSTSTDISTLTLSYTNVTGLQNIPIQEVSPAWEGGGIPEVSYTIDPALPDGLAIDADSGVISGTPTTVQEAQDYTVTATGVEPAYTGTNTATLKISVVSDKISLDTFNTFSYEAIEGIENVALTETDPTWGDGDAPTATYAVDPALPDGLTIDETTGVISGTPTAAQIAQNYTVTATGTIAYEGTKTATVSITIQGQINLNTLTFSYADINAVESVEITATSPTWADDAAPIVTYTVDALPDGLTINETTGEISGTPTTIQAAQDYTVTATGNGELFIGTQTAAVNIVVSINVDKIFARWKESDSYQAITEATTGTAIATVEELKNIQNDLTGTYYLTSNIDVSGAAWEPLGSTTPFTGTFNGNGYIVYGVTIEAASTDADLGKYQGLFAAVNNATVKDVGIGVERVSAVGIAGALIGEARGTSEIDNVAVARMADTAEVTISDVIVGGLVGNIIDTVKVTNAYNLEMVVKSTITTGYETYVGGLVGQATGNTIHGYTFTGDDNTKKIISGRYMIGGLVGNAAGASDVRGYVSGKGVIEGADNVGGLAGQIGAGSILRGYFDGGTVTETTGSTQGGTGGLVGRGRSPSSTSSQTDRITIIGYVTNATITGATIVGGLAGRVFATGVVTGYVVDSTLTGSGTSSSYSVGGLVGWIYHSSNTAVSGYVMGGSISGVSGAGGLVGILFSSTQPGIAKVGGYVTTRVTASANQTSARAFVSSYEPEDTSISGYWDKNVVGNLDQSRGTAISAIANIVYDSTTGAYTDSGNNNMAVFDNADFLTQFSLPGASAQRPDLRPYRVLPYKATLDADVTAVNLVAAAPWDNTDTVTWSSSNTAVVTVDANGVITKQGAGSATITATWSGGGTATMSVTVQ